MDVWPNEEAFSPSVPFSYAYGGELGAKIEVNAIFVNGLCGDTFNDLLKVEPKAISKGYVWDMLPPLEKAS